MAPRWLYALFGLVATLVGMAVGHLTAALTNPDASPVLAVGSAVVELTPRPVASWAIEQFGDKDKPILVGSVLIGVLVLAAVAGLLARRRFLLGAGLLVVLVAVAAAAVLTRPVVEAYDVVPSVMTALTGVAALWFLDRTARRASGAGTKPRAVLTDEPSPEHTPEDTHAGPSRRGVLISAGILAAAAAVFGGAGRFIIGIRSRAEDVALPEPAAGGAAPALPQDLSRMYDGITPLQIDNADFYRVDTRLDVPVVDSDSWTLTVDGDVEESFEITFDELLEMDMVERDITLTCVSNTVGGPYVGGARWLGVPLQTIIDRAKPGSGVDQMLATDFDGMTIGTPYDLLTDGREALLCVGMNGEQLPREHGFPVRVVVPGLYGFISATKWVTRLTFTTYAEKESYWTERKWDTRAPIKPSARIDTPQSLSQVGAGKVVIGGVAWAQNDGGVSKVQVQLDGGPWRDATTGPDVNNVYWRQWFLETEVGPGAHVVAARVVDGDGDLQTDVKAKPFPGGASGVHSFSFTAN